MGWTKTSGPPKISRIENGREMPTANTVQKWAEATGNEAQIPELLAMLTELQSRHVRRRKLISDGEAPLQADFDQRIRGAEHIRNMEIAFIPGLLQTPAYARAIFAQVEAVFGIPDVDAAVRARMQRQQVLYEPIRFEFLITEAALRLLPCPAGVMLGQLDRLLTVSSMENVTLGIIAFGELSMTPVNGFLMLDDKLIVETYSGEDTEHGDEAEIHRRIFDMLMANALTGDEARRLIMSVAEQLRGTH
jgi:hypothetical protein